MRRQEQRRRVEDLQLDRALNQLASDACRAAEATLNAAGFHRHYRWKWRRGTVATRAVRIHLKHPDDLGMDLAIEEQLISLASGDHEETKEGMRREIRQMAAELAGARPLAIERHLATTAAICWFALRIFELQSLGEENLPVNKWTDYHQRRVSAAHRRYVRTVQALASIRRGFALAGQEERGREVVRELLAGAADHDEGRAAPDRDTTNRFTTNGRP
jgi:hypothetical protein